MKAFLLFLVLLPVVAFASEERIDGVPYRCSDQTRFVMIRDFARENPGDRDEVQSYREMIRLAPAYACRERANPSTELFAWCDGSGCSGATATVDSTGRCRVSDIWFGQDDQDSIDPVEHRRNCLVRSDFRR